MGVSELYVQFEFTNGYEMLHKAGNSKGEMPYRFPIFFSPILTQIGRFRTIGQSQLSNPSDLPCFLFHWG